MEHDDYAWLDDDWGDSAEWVKTDELYRCLSCGGTGPAEEKCMPELQGESPMVGYVMISTGDLRCVGCGHDELEPIDAESREVSRE